MPTWKTVGIWKRIAKLLIGSQGLVINRTKITKTSVNFCFKVDICQAHGVTDSELDGPDSGQLLGAVDAFALRPEAFPSSPLLNCVPVIAVTVISLLSQLVDHTPGTERLDEQFVLAFCRSSRMTVTLWTLCVAIIYPLNDPTISPPYFFSVQLLGPSQMVTSAHTLPEFT
ncbi:hypothetical protein TNCV_1382171 [Trichonephila clavipes]|nr:hypothetical protein TNCV_1382171 [Trichonephila clavipes]